jgi:MFS family permease
MTYDWRWIFWMNLPFGLVAYGLATWLMPNIKADVPPALDVKGFLLSGGGLTLSVLGLTVAGRGLFSGPEVVVMIASGVLLLIAYVFHARHFKSPILDLRLLRIPTYRHSMMGGNLFRIAVGAVPFIMPLMLQLGFGFTPFASGMVTFASAFGALSMKFTVARIVRFFGYRSLLIVNGLLCCTTFAAMGFFTAATPYWIMIAVLLVGGFMRSLQFSSLNTLAYADVDSTDIARANTLYTVVQQLFLALGVAVAAFLLDFRLWWSGRSELVVADFAFVLFVTAAISAFAILSYLRLESDAGSSVSGHAGDGEEGPRGEVTRA